MTYLDELKNAMKLLDKEGYYFIGQNMRWGGTSMFHTIKDIPEKRRIELPVIEDCQMGMSIGLALEGYLPLSIYPRWDFLILAANQLVNHLDKLKILSEGQFDPFIIIRTAVGSTAPLFPGEQHNQNHSEAFKKMLKYVKVYELKSAKDIVPTYKKILEEKVPAITVEYPDLYDTE